jgi:isopenicillin N synthase-like dioxygenase
MSVNEEVSEVPKFQALKNSGVLDTTVEAFKNVRTIDISPLYSSDPEERRAAAIELGNAVRITGFAYVSGHQVSPQVVEGVIRQAKAFFSLPLDHKMRWYIGNSQHHRGYVPEGEEVFSGGTYDRKEAFDLGYDLPENDPDVVARTPTMGPNIWPDIPSFKEEVGAYYAAVLELGNVLFRGFALALGLEENYFSRFVTKPPSQMRLIHYPFNLDAHNAVGIGAHADYECFTILLPTAPGLEVLNGDGDWIDAPPNGDAFVINVGEMMEVWTNGQFPATPHRVRKVKEERYSVPLFCLCDYNTVVEPLPEFVSPERPPQYSPLVAGAHLFARTAQTFTYLKRRVERGELVIPSFSPPMSSFGRQAREESEKTS